MARACATPVAAQASMIPTTAILRVRDITNVLLICSIKSIWVSAAGCAIKRFFKDWDDRSSRLAGLWQHKKRAGILAGPRLIMSETTDKTILAKHKELNFVVLVAVTMPLLLPR